MLDGRSILVTGGTGSFGRAFTREVLRRYEPRRLVIFSRDEQKHYDMSKLLPVDEHPCLRYFIGDVRDLDRLKRAMDGVDLVLHAAAMKHVPIAEYNPFECIRTNITGSENVIQAAIETGVEKVLALSTDKAANPVNLYGATKLAADKCFVAGNHLAGESGPYRDVVIYTAAAALVVADKAGDLKQGAALAAAAVDGGAARAALDRMVAITNERGGG